MTALSYGAATLLTHFFVPYADPSLKSKYSTNTAASTKAQAALSDQKTAWNSYPTDNRYRMSLPANFERMSPHPEVESYFSEKRGSLTSTVRTLSLPGRVGQRAFRVWLSQAKLPALAAAVKPILAGATQMSPDIFQRGRYLADRVTIEGGAFSCVAAPSLISNQVVLVEVCSELAQPYAQRLLEVVVEQSERGGASTLYANMAPDVAVTSAGDTQLAGLTEKQALRVKERQDVWQKRRGLECLGKATPLELEQCYETETATRLVDIEGGVDLKATVVASNTDESTVELVTPEIEQLNGSGAAMDADLPTVVDTNAVKSN